MAIGARTNNEMIKEVANEFATYWASITEQRWVELSNTLRDTFGERQHGRHKIPSSLIERCVQKAIADKNAIIMRNLTCIIGIQFPWIEFNGKNAPLKNFVLLETKVAGGINRLGNKLKLAPLNLWKGGAIENIRWGDTFDPHNPSSFGMGSESIQKDNLNRRGSISGHSIPPGTPKTPTGIARRNSISGVSTPPGTARRNSISGLSTPTATPKTPVAHPGKAPAGQFAGSTPFSNAQHKIQTTLGTDFFKIITEGTIEHKTFKEFTFAGQMHYTSLSTIAEKNGDEELKEYWLKRATEYKAEREKIIKL